MELDKKDVGNRLKEFAKEKFGGIKGLGNAIGLSQPNLSGTYINGRSLPGAELLFVSPALLTMVLNGKRQLTKELRHNIINTGIASVEDFSGYDFEEVKRGRINNEYVFQIEKLNDIVLHQEYMLKMHKEIVERVYRENENLHSELVKALKLINKLKSGEFDAKTQ